MIEYGQVWRHADSVWVAIVLHNHGHPDLWLCLVVYDNGEIGPLLPYNFLYGNMWKRIA